MRAAGAEPAAEQSERGAIPEDGTKATGRSATAPGDVGRLAALAAVDRALRREAHVLAERPELTWQQLHNRLQWADPPLADRLTAERERRSGPGSRPWLHRYTRLVESEALRRTIAGHPGGVAGVVGVAISPDGTWLATASDDDTVKTWEAASGTERATLAGHAGRVSGVAISPDGTWLATASADHTAKIWDAASGTERATLAGHAGGLSSVAISRDGTWLATASDNGSAKIWDAATGAERATLSGGDWMTGVAISADGSWLATTSLDRTAKIWDAATGAQRATLAGHADMVLGVAISPDGTWLATASADGTAKIWDAASGTERATLAGHAGRVLGVAISRDGTWLATASADGTAKIWDAATGLERATLAGHASGVWVVAISPDGSWLATGSSDHMAKIWDAATAVEPATHAGHADMVWEVAISPDGTWLATGSADGTAKIWDAATGLVRATLTGHTDMVLGVAISPDGTWLATTSRDCTAKTWDAATGIERATLAGHTNTVVEVAISPDGTWLATTSLDHTAKTWDAATGIERATLAGHTDVVGEVAISPDGTWLATASPDCTARIWDAATGAERATLLGHTEQVLKVAISPDGMWLATASADRTAKLWDAATGIERATISGHTGRVSGVAISPDGTWLATASAGCTAQIWDAATGAERVTLSGHVDGVAEVAISPDGTWLATASLDCTARIWDAATGTELATLLLGGSGYVVAVHPFAPVVACGDRIGGVHLARLIGVTKGPLVVTATEDRGTLTVRCSACRQPFLLDPDRLGMQATCPQPACHRELQVNPFVIHAGGAREPAGDAAQPRPSATSAVTSGVPTPHPIDPVPDAEFLNPPLERPWISPPLPPPEPARPEPQVHIENLAVAAPAVRATPSLGELVAQSGLRYLDVGGGSLAMSFESTRAERLVVQARTLESGLAFFLVSLPQPGLFGGEAALRSLLGVSFRADYVKALVFPGGELAFACEQQLALLSPARVRGLVAGLAALGDVKKGDLADAPGWDRRLLACRLAQAAHIALDPAQASAAIRSLAAEGGLPVRESGPGALVVELAPLGAGAPLRLVTRVTERLVSIIAFLGDAKPKGNKSAYMRRMLELNRAADVARLGLDADGDVALLYEVPEVRPDLFSRVREQFGRLLAGVLTLERGG